MSSCRRMSRKVFYCTRARDDVSCLCCESVLDKLRPEWEDASHEPQPFDILLCEL